MYNVQVASDIVACWFSVWYLRREGNSPFSLVWNHDVHVCTCKAEIKWDYNIIISFIIIRSNSNFFKSQRLAKGNSITILLSWLYVTTL